MRSSTRLVAVLALYGCPGGGGGAAPQASASVPAVLRDTTGAMFEVVGGDLDEFRPLDAASLAGAPCPAPLDSLPVGEAAFWVGETGLPMVCLTDPEGGGPLDCRPLGCEAAAQCPPGAACVGAGVCHYVHGPYEADPARVDNLEVAALCAAAVPWGPCTEPGGYARVAELVDAACQDAPDGLCEVPAECEP